MNKVCLDDKLVRRNKAISRNNWFISHYRVALGDSEKYYPLTTTELQQIKDFWEPYEYAIQNNDKLQWIFSRASGIFDPSYIGFGTQLNLLNTFWNHYSYTYCRNKINMPFVFKDIRCPETVVSNNYGFFQDADRNLITFADAVQRTIDILKDEPELLIKPSQEGEGVGVDFISNKATTQEIKALFIKYKKDFIIQKVLKNHISISELYSRSLNTFRMSSLSWKGQLSYNGSCLRIGQNARVDNAARGGLFIRVNNDGSLNDYALDEVGNIYWEHPVTKIPFKNRVIPNFDKVINLCLKVHGQIPQQRILSLDVALEESGEPVLVETNSPGGCELLQLSGINPYHNSTTAKEIFDIYLKESFYVLYQNDDFIFREFADHVSIVKYKGSKLLCEIPEMIADKPVWKIYDNAFQNTLTKMVVISAKITTEPHTFDNGRKQIVVEKY